MKAVITIDSGFDENSEDIKCLIQLANAEIQKNTGLRTGKLTLIEVDKLARELEFKFSNPQNYIPEMNESWVKGLFIIDAVLKPNDIDTHKGYQQARISYIPEKELEHYYTCLDKGRESHPNNTCHAIIAGITQFVKERSDSCK